MQVLTTRWYNDRAWLDGAELIDRRSTGKWGVLRSVFHRAPRADALVVMGSLGWSDRYIDLVAGLVLKALPAKRRPVLVVTDATWEMKSRSLSDIGLGRLTPAAARLGIHVLDGDHVVYLVFSNEEQHKFAANWGVAPERVAMSLYHVTHRAETLQMPTRDDGYIFAGGDPLRDYDLLLRATEDVAMPLRIASRKFATDPRDGLEVGPVDPEEFVQLESGATVVVVPLLTGTQRSAGQQTYLNALARGKPLIVTDAPGVRDLLVPDVHALVVPPTTDEMRAAIQYAIDPANAEEVRKRAERGRSWVMEHFTFDRYRKRVLDITRIAVESRRNGRLDLTSVAREEP